MSNRFNTIAGWTLFSGIVLLGLSAVSSRYYEGGKNERPEKMGFEIAGVVQEGEGGGKDATPFEAYLAKADIAKGEKTFAKCASCHTIDQGGAAGLGPNLWGTLGANVASHPFAYSDALKGKGGKWDWTSMSAWLENPAKYASGTKMSFAGLPDPQERANLMVYLNSKSASPLPLPAVPEAPAAGAAPEAAAVVGDAAKGQKSFAKCAACHTITPGGANGIGPNLVGVFGEGIGQGRGGYAFSDALKGKGGNWDDASLDAWLADPAKFAAGNKMTFAGISDAQERANIIAYLKSVK